MAGDGESEEPFTKLLLPPPLPEAISNARGWLGNRRTIRVMHFKESGKMRPFEAGPILLVLPSGNSIRLYIPINK